MFNLTFLNSSALILSLSTLIPLLIYLFAKKRPPRIIFSSIRFIQLSEKRQKKKVNLKNLLLLIIRMLIILLTVLAISRPAIKLENLKGNKNHPPTAIALILDNSYSMDYVVDSQTELDKGLQIAETIGGMLTKDDISILLTMEKSWNEQNAGLNFGSFSADALHSIEITSQVEKLGDVISLAEERLKESQIANREIYFVTDLQQQEFTGELESSLYIIPTSALESRQNLSIENAFISSNFVERGSERQIEFQVVNNSDNPVDDVICSLTLDGTTVAEQVTDLQPEEKQQNSFVILLERPGWHSGYVSVRDERLLYDNRYYFAFYYNQQPRVGIITSESSLPLTLQTILSIYTGNEDNIDIISDNISLENLKDYDNLIVWKYADWSGQLQFVLSNLQQQGQNLLFLADTELNERAREYLAAEFKLEFKNVLEQETMVKLTQVNRYHPVAARLDAERPAAIRGLWQTTTSASVILEAETNPLVIEEAGNLLWLFDVNDLRSAFLVDANYPILAYNSLLYTASSGLGNRQFLAGTLYRPLAEPFIYPDGSSFQTGGRKILLRQPGLYLEGDEKLPLVVNLDYSESRFRNLTLPDDKLITLCDADWQETIFQARYGFELWKYLLLAVLLLFAIEIIIVKSEEKKA
ncbi:MAG: BatA domain-containing protein [Candidatus Cloacimonetes bacterium]|nr:BatA domain-containing protein [Candidatus Cloacimonadota bacterium]